MKSVAARTLQKRALMVMGEYMVVLLGAAYLANKKQRTGFDLWFLASMPTLAMVAFFLIFGRYLRDERDEYKRDLAVRCILWGTAGMMTMQFLAGFLRIFGWPATFPPFAEIWVFAAFALLAKLSYRMRDRVPVDA